MFSVHIKRVYPPPFAVWGYTVRSPGPQGSNTIPLLHNRGYSGTSTAGPIQYLSLAAFHLCNPCIVERLQLAIA